MGEWERERKGKDTRKQVAMDPPHTRHQIQPPFREMVPSPVLRRRSPHRYPCPLIVLYSSLFLFDLICFALCVSVGCFALLFFSLLGLAWRGFSGLDGRWSVDSRPKQATIRAEQKEMKRKSKTQRK